MIPLKVCIFPCHSLQLPPLEKDFWLDVSLMCTTQCDSNTTPKHTPLIFILIVTIRALNTAAMPNLTTIPISTRPKWYNASTALTPQRAAFIDTSLLYRAASAFQRANIHAMLGFGVAAGHCARVGVACVVAAAAGWQADGDAGRDSTAVNFEDC